MPGVSGAAVRAAIEQIANAEEECDLLVQKRKSPNGRFHLTVTVKKI